MESLGLFVGHLIGDYIVQNDWMAKWKTEPSAGPPPKYTVDADPNDSIAFAAALEKRNKEHDEYPNRIIRARTGDLACFIHCLLYTLAIWACSFWWMPYWGLAVVFLTHYPIDRYRLAYRWMQYSGQKHFSSKEHLMFPWSIVAVDNTFHLVTLFVIGLIHYMF